MYTRQGGIGSGSSFSPSGSVVFFLFFGSSDSKKVEKGKILTDTCPVRVFLVFGSAGTAGEGLLTI